MSEKIDYISEDALKQLILQVEQEELVAAPPDLLESILMAAGLEETNEVSMRISKKMRKKEFYSYCFRVITSMAAAIALVFLLPAFSGMNGGNASLQENYRRELPSMEEVVEAVPSRTDIVSSKNMPTKEEVLSSMGVIDKILDYTGWFDKKEK